MLHTSVRTSANPNSGMLIHAPDASWREPLTAKRHRSVRAGCRCHRRRRHRACPFLWAVVVVGYSRSLRSVGTLRWGDGVGGRGLPYVLTIMGCRYDSGDCKVSSQGGVGPVLTAESSPAARPGPGALIVQLSAAPLGKAWTDGARGIYYIVLVRAGSLAGVSDSSV